MHGRSFKCGQWYGYSTTWTRRRELIAHQANERIITLADHFCVSLLYRGNVFRSRTMALRRIRIGAHPEGDKASAAAHQRLRCAEAQLLAGYRGRFNLRRPRTDGHRRLSWQLNVLFVAGRRWISSMASLKSVPAPVARRVARNEQLSKHACRRRRARRLRASYELDGDSAARSMMAAFFHQS